MGHDGPMPLDADEAAEWDAREAAEDRQEIEAEWLDLLTVDPPLVATVDTKGRT